MKSEKLNYWIKFNKNLFFIGLTLFLLIFFIINKVSSSYKLADHLYTSFKIETNLLFPVITVIFYLTLLIIPINGILLLISGTKGWGYNKLESRKQIVGGILLLGITALLVLIGLLLSN